LENCADTYPIELALAFGQRFPIWVICQLQMFHFPMKPTRKKLNRFFARRWTGLSE